MARIPTEELERLKREVSVQRLAEARGVELKRMGKDLRGRCPFHAPDSDPSLSVDPERNVFHCFGCGAKGSVVDWVMRAEGVSFRHAVEILRADYPNLTDTSAGDPPPKRSSTLKLPQLVQDREASDAELRDLVASYYHATLKESPAALEYLESRGLKSAEMVERFQLGFSNRTLGYHLPQRNRQAGQQIRDRLEELGIIKRTGHELLRGSLVIPIHDGHGRVVQMYGRKITPRLRKGTPLHLYLPGPRRGVFNLDALRASKEVILCESLIDALTFWVHGLRNVTTAYGTNGFTDEMLEAFKAYGTERALIAYDRDDAGETAAEGLAERLGAEGLECFRVLFPRGMDANSYALKVTPAAKSLELLIRKAQWLGKGRAPGQPATRPVVETLQAEATPPPENPTETSVSDESKPASFLVAAPQPASPAETQENPASSPHRSADESSPPPAPATPLPAAPQLEIPAEVTATEVTITLGDRRYRVRGLGKNMAYDVLKVNLLVSTGELFHVDTFNLYSARQRTVFANQAATELAVKEEVVKKDLGKVLLKLEELQDEQIKRALAPEDTTVRLSDAEQAEALAFLEDSRLLERISEDFSTCGLVGEDTNKLVGYLAAVSRKLDRPLAVIVQSSSAAGKSALLEAVLAFMPPEERVSYSAMTGQSLFYMGETDLKHKILAIAEEEGAERASYALKLLQSEGELSIASTGKDPSTGRLVTHEYHVEGPAAILLTTTAVDLDEELLNRCIVLAVDETREQTRAIHRRQREARTLGGLERRTARDGALRVHRNAQRLLRPLFVVNPYAERLTFLDDTTRTRRDHEKYLALIDALALLHQRQREVKTGVVRGRRVEYVEATLDDVAVANRLAGVAIGRTLDELPPQTRRLLFLVEEMVRAECARRTIERSSLRFSRRDVREHTGWGNTQLKVHLHRLEEMEYLLVHRGGRGQAFVYELLYDGQGKSGQPFVLGLVDVGSLGYDHDRSGSEDDRSASSRAVVGGMPGGGRTDSTAAAQGDGSASELKPPNNAHPAGATQPASYVNEPARPAVAVSAAARSE